MGHTSEQIWSALDVAGFGTLDGAVQQYVLDRIRTDGWDEEHKNLGGLGNPSYGSALSQDSARERLRAESESTNIGAVANTTAIDAQIRNLEARIARSSATQRRVLDKQLIALRKKRAAILANAARNVRRVPPRNIPRGRQYAQQQQQQGYQSQGGYQGGQVPGFPQPQDDGTMPAGPGMVDDGGGDDGGDGGDGDDAGDGGDTDTGGTVPEFVGCGRLDTFATLGDAAQALIGVARRAAPRDWSHASQAEDIHPIEDFEIGAFTAALRAPAAMSAGRRGRYRRHYRQPVQQESYGDDDSPYVDGVPEDIAGIGTVVTVALLGALAVALGVGIRTLRMKMRQLHDAGIDVCMTKDSVGADPAAAEEARKIVGDKMVARALAAGFMFKRIAPKPIDADALTKAMTDAVKAAPPVTGEAEYGEAHIDPAGVSVGFGVGWWPGFGPSAASEEVFRGLLSDWEAFTRLGVGDTVLKYLRPDVESWVTFREAWKHANIPASPMGSDIAGQLNAQVDAANRIRKELADAKIKDEKLTDHRAGVSVDTENPTATGVMKEVDEAEKSLKKLLKGAGDAIKPAAIVTGAVVLAVGAAVVGTRFLTPPPMQIRVMR